MIIMVGGFPACCFGEVFSLGRDGFGGVLLLGLFIVLRQLGRVLCGGNTKEMKMTNSKMNITVSKTRQDKTRQDIIA